jgi:hypothetical protein
LSQFFARITLFVGAAVVAGCSTPPVATTVEHAPPDFTVSIIVIDKPGSRVSRPRDSRPGRYVLQPDLTLRALVTRTPRIDSLPPPMRQLRAPEVDEIWKLVQAGGYLDLPGDAHLAESESLEPRVTKLTAGIFVRGLERQRSTIVEMDSEEAKHIRAIVEKMAALAWIEP